MKRWLCEFFTFYKSRAHPKGVVWNNEDAVALNQFLQSSTGKRLMDVMSINSFEQDRQATIRTSGHEWGCGVAAGFRLALAVLSNYAQPSADAGETTKDSEPRAAVLRDRISP